MTAQPQLRPLMKRIADETVGLIVADINSKGIIVTGRLRDSIDYQIVPNRRGYGLKFEMVYYGEYVDQGTRYIEPREFFKRIIDAQMNKYKQDIAIAYVNDVLNGIPIY